MEVSGPKLGDMVPMKSCGIMVMATKPNNLYLDVASQEAIAGQSLFVKTEAQM